MQAAAYFLSIGAFTLALSYFLFVRGASGGLDAQLVANRRIPYPLVGIWMAIAFTWGATFFFAGQLAYEAGVFGLAFYMLGNGGGLALAFVIACKMRAPQRTYSLAEVMRDRFSPSTGWVYSIGIVGMQAGYALPVQFLAAAALLKFTMDADPTYTILAAATAMIVPVVIGGIRSSAVLDLIKGVMMIALIAVLVPLAIVKAGGIDTLFESLQHRAVPRAAEQGGDWLYAFVLVTGGPLFVSLISAGPVDQTLFQRYFSVRHEARRWVRTVLAAGVLFFVLNILAAAILGFLASNASLGIEVESGRIAGFAAMRALIPSLAVFFIITVIAAFVASGDAALNASSGVWAKEVYHGWWRTSASERDVMRVQRMVMVLFIVVATAIALTGIDMLSLVIAVGVFRSALLVPTVIGLLVPKDRVPDVFGAVLTAMVVSAVLYGIGKYCSSANVVCELPVFSPEAYAFLGSIAGWIITGAYCWIVSTKNRSFEKDVPVRARQ